MGNLHSGNINLKILMRKMIGVCPALPVIVFIKCLLCIGCTELTDELKEISVTERLRTKSRSRWVDK